MQYSKLFDPITIGNLRLKNRIAMTGIGSALPSIDGEVTDDYIAYFSERAKGGAGLLITEVVRVCDGHGLTARYQLSAAHDFLIPGMKRLVEAVHQYDCRLLLQLHHPGRETFDNILGGQQAVSPSGIPCPVNKANTRALSHDEILELIEQFGDAALRIQKSGADGIEIHGGHGYLFHQFLSPATNKRGDEYGGSFENRFRFLKDVIDNIRGKCGNGFTICVRTSLEDFAGKEAIDLDLGVAIAKRLEDLGTVDIINATVGVYETGISNMIETCAYPQGWRDELLRALRKEIRSTPILAVNCIRSPEFAEWMLEHDLADLIGLGRPMLADPEWANKAKEDRADEIRPCINCVYCLESLRDNVGDDNVRNACAVNARTFRESLYDSLRKDGDNRSIVVVGAGPAGLEASRVLALRGFRVTLFEKRAKLGGQLNLASVPKDKYRIDGLVNYYARQMELLHVELRLNTEATAERVMACRPCAVFVSTGSEPIVPKAIRGIDGPNVHTVPEILEGTACLRNHSVAVIGSGMTGLETAEYLAARGNVVSVVEMLDEIGPDVYFQNREDLLCSLAKEAVDFYPSHKLEKIMADGIEICSMKSGKKLFLPVEHVVLSVGVRADTSLLEQLKAGAGVPVIPIGDAACIGRIHSAIHGGFQAGYEF